MFKNFNLVLYRSIIAAYNTLCSKTKTLFTSLLKSRLLPPIRLQRQKLPLGSRNLIFRLPPLNLKYIHSPRSHRVEQPIDILCRVVSMEHQPDQCRALGHCGIRDGIRIEAGDEYVAEQMGFVAGAYFDWYDVGVHRAIFPVLGERNGQDTLVECIFPIGVF